MIKKIKQFLINKDQPLTEQIIINIIQIHESNNKLLFKKRGDYYDGDHPILLREMDDGRPNNKIVENMCSVITDNFAGYAVGLPVSYSGEDIDDILYSLQYNDVVAEDINFYKDALIYGRGVETQYIDTEGKNRFTTIDPKDIIPVYSDNLEKELLYVIRLIKVDNWEENNQLYYVDVYDRTNKITYQSQVGYNSLTKISEESHFFNQVPFCIFELDDSVTGCCDQIYSLQDALDSLTSDGVNEIDSFVNSYLVIKGATLDEEGLKEAKKKRCLLLDNDSSAEFLTRDANQTNIESTKTDIQNRIFEIAGCANFNDEAFGNASGIALRYKLLNMETRTSVWLDRFKKALQKRIELISYILKLKGDDQWVTIDIDFTRNVPQDSTEYATTVATLRGIVSDETLLQLLPFVDDPAEEAKKLEEQNERNMELYMNTGNLEDDEEQ